MQFGIGFLAAALLALAFAPLVHRRAVRLTERRLEAATPLALSEMRADKDQQRAAFAMSTRRLEISLAQMRATTTAKLAELSQKSDTIHQLKKQLDEKVAALDETVRELSDKAAAMRMLETSDKALRAQLRAVEDELGHKAEALQQAERMLADKEAELVRMVAKLGEHALEADSQRAELESLRMQVEAMIASVAECERALTEPSFA